RFEGGAVELFAAPAAQSDLRVPLDDLGWLHDALFGQLPARALGEHVGAAGELDELAHPADGGDGGLVPLLEVHARSARATAGPLAQRLDAADVARDQRLGARPGVHQPPERQDDVQDLLHAALVEDQYREIS